MCYIKKFLKYFVNYKIIKNYGFGKQNCPYSCSTTQMTIQSMKGLLNDRTKELRVKQMDVR